MRDPQFSHLERRLGPLVFHDIPRDELIAYLAAPARRVRLVFNVNAHALNLALRDPAFLRLLNEADLCFCDGFGIKILARLFGDRPVRHRVTVPDFIEDTFAALHRRGGTAFLLGDDPGVADAYAAQLNARHPGVAAGARDGFFHSDPRKEEEVLDLLRRLRPDFVPVGMGMPLQEKWIGRHLGTLPPATYFAAGSTFSWMSQARKRGPKWAVDNGLEWLFRLLNEPSRVWKRYLIGLPAVVIRLALYRLSCRPAVPPPPR